MSDKNEFSENKIDQEPKKIKRLRLTNSRDVRRYVANLMKRVENSEIEESKARLLNNLAETILKSIRSDEIEKKLLEVESILNERNDNNSNNNPFDDDNNYFIKPVN